MRLWLPFCVICAALLHLGFVLFGGVLFPADAKEGTLQEVELLSEEVEKEAEKPKEEPQAEPEDVLESEAEEIPEGAEIDLEEPTIDDAPRLDDASLSAIEAALSGQVLGGGDFAETIDLASGGRIGGTGKAGTLAAELEGAFDLGEIDQKPRAVFQGAPLFPSSMRGKKVDGMVTLIFVVDATGKVVNPRVEKSSHPAFDKPALDAVKKWKFEPAVKGGQRVSCKMRVPIRFTPS